MRGGRFGVRVVRGVVHGKMRRHHDPWNILSIRLCRGEIKFQPSFLGRIEAVHVEADQVNQTDIGTHCDGEREQEKRERGGRGGVEKKKRARAAKREEHRERVCERGESKQMKILGKNETREKERNEREREVKQQAPLPQLVYERLVTETHQNEMCCLARFPLACANPFRTGYPW